MKVGTKIISTLAILLAGISGSYGQEETDQLPALPIHLDTLDNGLVVVYQPDPATDDVSVEFWMRAGTAHEEADQYGLAHFYEHVTPYGLEGKPDQRSVFDTHLTGSNAQTLKDFTRYYLKTQPAGLAVTLEYAADRMAASSDAITDSKVEHQRERVLSEIGRQSKHPFWSIEGATALDQAGFGTAHPYGHSGYGTLANNQHFTVADFQNWHTRYLHPENSILFIIGNFEEPEARILVERYFAPIPKREAQAPIAIPDIDQLQRIMEVQTASGSQVHYCVQVWGLPEYGHPDHPQLLLTAYILENRLKQVLSDGWSMPGEASPGVSYRVFRKGGQLTAYLPFAEGAREMKVSQELKNLVQDLLSQGFTAAELAMAKAQANEDMRGRLDKLGFQSSRTELIGQGLLFMDDPYFYQKEWEALRAASVIDVQQVVEKWLTNGAAEVTIFGEPKTKEKDKNK